MKAANIDRGAPAWILQGARAQGPFKIAEVYRDHVALKVPHDFRYWAQADKVPETKHTSFEIAPISLITQDESEARKWNEHNEPRVGDLVVVNTIIWSKDFKVRRPGLVTGVVVALTAQQVHIFDPNSSMKSKSRRFTKDSCVVVSRPKK